MNIVDIKKIRTLNKFNNDVLTLSNTLLRNNNKHNHLELLLQDFVQEIKGLTAFSFVGVSLTSDNYNTGQKASSGLTSRCWQNDNVFFGSSAQCKCLKYFEKNLHKKFINTSDKGSIFLNDLSLIKRFITTEEDAHDKNTCSILQLASVALIPIFYNSITLGFILVGDILPNMISAKTIQSLESIVPDLGITINRIRKQDSFSGTNKQKDIHKDSDLPSKHYFLNIIESAQDIVLIFSANLELEYINEAGVILLNKAQRSSKNIVLTNLIHENCAKELAHKLKTVVDTKMSMFTEQQIILIDGESTWQDLAITPMLDGKKEISSVSVFGRDITENKNFELSKNVLHKISSEFLTHGITESIDYSLHEAKKHIMCDSIFVILKDDDRWSAEHSTGKISEFIEKRFELNNNYDKFLENLLVHKKNNISILSNPSDLSMINKVLDDEYKISSLIAKRFLRGCEVTGILYLINHNSKRKFDYPEQDFTAKLASIFAFYLNKT